MRKTIIKERKTPSRKLPVWLPTFHSSTANLKDFPCCSPWPTALHTCVLCGDCGSPLPKTYCVPGTALYAGRSLLGQPSPRPAPPTRPSHLWLTPTSFGFDFFLWFGSVLFVIIFFFIFSFPSFVSPPPPRPSRFPSPPPTFSPPQ